MVQSKTYRDPAPGFARTNRTHGLVKKNFFANVYF